MLVTENSTRYVSMTLLLADVMDDFCVFLKTEIFIFEYTTIKPSSKINCSYQLVIDI